MNVVGCAKGRGVAAVTCFTHGRAPGSGYGTGGRFEEAAAVRLSFMFAPTSFALPLRAARPFPGRASRLKSNEGRIRVANIKSQIKRIKQNEKAHQRNKAVKSELRTHVRKFREAVE